jgi:hypothetical protein
VEGAPRRDRLVRVAGAPPTAARARARADEILAAPAVPFPDDLGRELDTIISAAEAAAR